MSGTMQPFECLQVDFAGTTTTTMTTTTSHHQQQQYQHHYHYSNGSSNSGGGNSGTYASGGGRGGGNSMVRVREFKTVVEALEHGTLAEEVVDVYRKRVSLDVLPPVS